MTATTTPTAFARERFPLWGGEAVVAVSERGGLAGALTHVKRTVAAFDLACSSFRDDSELALLNASGAEECRGQLAAVRARSARPSGRARLTDGAVDPTVGQALIAHGINPPSSDRPVQIAAVRGYRAVKLDEAANSITLPPGSSSISAPPPRRSRPTCAAQAAASAAGCGVLIGLCGDIAVAGDPPTGGWTIRVTDDHRAATARADGRDPVGRPGDLEHRPSVARRRRTAVTT